MILPFQFYNGSKHGRSFRCCFCGNKFKVDDNIRWIYTNDLINATGNPLICESCYGEKSVEDIRKDWINMCEEADGKFWWFTRHTEY